MGAATSTLLCLEDPSSGSGAVNLYKKSIESNGIDDGIESEDEGEDECRILISDDEREDRSNFVVKSKEEGDNKEGVEEFVEEMVGDSVLHLGQVPVFDQSLQRLEEGDNSPEVRMQMPHNTPSNPTNLGTCMIFSPSKRIDNSNGIYDKMKILSDIQEIDDKENDDSTSAVSNLMSFQSPAIGSYARQMNLDDLPARSDFEGSLTTFGSPLTDMTDNISQADSTADTVRLQLSSPFSMASIENEMTPKVRLLHGGSVKPRQESVLKMSVVLPPAVSVGRPAHMYPFTADNSYSDMTPSESPENTLVVTGPGASKELEALDVGGIDATKDITIRPGKKMSLRKHLKKAASIMFGFSTRSKKPDSALKLNV